MGVLASVCLLSLLLLLIFYNKCTLLQSKVYRLPQRSDNAALSTSMEKMLRGLCPCSFQRQYIARNRALWIWWRTLRDIASLTKHSSILFGGPYCMCFSIEKKLKAWWGRAAFQKHFCVIIMIIVCRGGNSFKISILVPTDSALSPRNILPIPYFEDCTHSLFLWSKTVLSPFSSTSFPAAAGSSFQRNTTYPAPNERQR